MGSAAERADGHVVVIDFFEQAVLASGGTPQAGPRTAWSEFIGAPMANCSDRAGTSAGYQPAICSDRAGTSAGTLAWDISRAGTSAWDISLTKSENDK